MALFALKNYIKPGIFPINLLVCNDLDAYICTPYCKLPVYFMRMVR